MQNKITKESLQQYKEILIKSSKQNQIYYFEFLRNTDDQKTISGFYAISGEKKFISSSAISQMFKEKKYEKIISKYFDISSTDQQLFYQIIDSKIWSKVREPYKDLIAIINSNKKMGTSRKFMLADDGSRINIELPINTEYQEI